MAAISSPGIGSGLDINAIVGQLVALERRPLNLLEQRESFLRAELSAYGQLKSNVSTFRSAMAELASLDQFKVFSPVSSNEAAFTATADGNAAAGNVQVDVSSIAERQKLASSAYADAATVVGTGTLTISVGADSFDVIIDATNNTLAGIRDAINNAAGNTGISVSTLNTDDGSRLVFTADETGTANALTIAVAGDAGLSQLAYDAGGTQNLTEIQAASDAVLTVDGFTVTSSSNNITGVIQGVTLELNAIGAGELVLDRDNDAILENVQKFVDAYNELQNSIGEFRAGALEADSALLSIERSLQRTINTPGAIPGSVFTYLSEIGIRTGEDGDLALNDSDFLEAMNTDFPGVAQLFGASGEGVAFRLDALADRFLASDGLIDAREDGINDRIDDIEDRKDALERRLILTEARLRAQFTALDGLLSQLQSTSSFLTQQLAQLQPFNSNR